MSTDELERAIRATLVDHANDVDGVGFTGPGGFDASRRQHGKRRAATVAGAALLVLALALVAGLAWNRSQHNAPSPAAGTPVFIPPTYSTIVNSNAPSMCADNVVRVVTNATERPLANCMGSVGLPELPSLTLSVGEEASIVGPSAQVTLTAFPDGIVQVQGTTIVAVSSGTATLHLEGDACINQSDSCDVVRVIVA